jgi:hypothetical protein
MLAELLSPSFLDKAILAQTSLVVHLEGVAQASAQDDLIGLLLAYEKATGKPHAVDAILPDLDDRTLSRKRWQALACAYKCA